MRMLTSSNILHSNTVLYRVFVVITNFLQAEDYRLSPRLNQVLSAWQKASLLVVFSVLLSACDQPFKAEDNLQTSNTKQQLASSSELPERYGRKALFSYPEFSGPYQVGSQLLQLTDWSRLDPLDPKNLDYRQLQVRFFYPKQYESLSPVNHPMLPVIDQASWNYLIGHQILAGKKLRYSNYHDARWNIQLDANLHQQNQPFPVLIFSHGYGYNHNSYSAMLGELASQGYIIVAINHSYGANPAYLAGGQSIWAKTLPKDDPGRFISLWSDDQRFVIDQLFSLNQTDRSPFYQKLDLSNLGLFGHSYGGAAAFYTASQDNRVKAIMNIDGSLLQTSENHLDQPFAYLLSKYHQPGYQFDPSSSPIFMVRLLKFRHQSFTDHILWWQWDFDDGSLSYQQLDALRAVELTSQLVDDFFAQTLKNQRSRWFKQNITKNSEMEIIQVNHSVR
ncbi:MAG: hypothetical protein Q9M92_14550 [Enterobacterales bacterium]|nr:hypothetical protein [Enterobacterales bacterium]